MEAKLKMADATPENIPFTLTADNKILVCKFSKNVKAKLYRIENSKTRGQTV